MADVPHAPEPPSPPGHGTVAEAADVLRVSRMTVYRLMDEGTIESLRIGHRRFVLWESIDRILTPGGTAS